MRSGEVAEIIAISPKVSYFVLFYISKEDATEKTKDNLRKNKR